MHSMPIKCQMTARWLAPASKWQAKPNTEREASQAVVAGVVRVHTAQSGLARGAHLPACQHVPRDA
jgi:hypothetical protein